MRGRERPPRQALEEIAGECFARREGDRMQKPVERTPLRLERIEQRGDVVIARDVAAQDRRLAELTGDLQDALA